MYLWRKGRFEFWKSVHERYEQPLEERDRVIRGNAFISRVKILR